METGEILPYSCLDPHATVGEAMDSEYNVTCANDGTTVSPSEWPECAVRCARPDPKAGYLPLPANVGVKRNGEKVRGT